ncbi:MAG TPA: nitroreductase family protein [Gemmatimonadaceae bacterium]
MTTTIAALIDQRYGSDTGLGEGVPASEGIVRMLDRRTHRKFAPRSIPEPLMQTLFACMQSSASKSDLQQYSVIRVRNPELRQKVAALVPSMPFIRDCPEFLVFCGDIARNRELCNQHGMPHANDNMDSFLNTAVDAALALQAFLLTAESVGLGCCPISVIRNRIDAVSELLALPPGVYPVAGLCVGYPIDAPAITPRLPQAVVVHTDAYDDVTMHDVVARYDAVRPIPTAKQKNVDTYGVKDGCGWSENVARQLSLPERAGFRDFLLRHGFALK